MNETEHFHLTLQLQPSAVCYTLSCTAVNVQYAIKLQLRIIKLKNTTHTNRFSEKVTACLCACFCFLNLTLPNLDM